MRFRDFIPIFTSVACISVPLFQACDGLDTAKGPDDNVYVTFEENNTLLSFCENNYEGTKNLVLNITVAGMTDDPINPMQIQESETFELENEASQILGGTEFPIEVPSTGTFQIAVELRGVLSCFDCCGEILVYENNNQTNEEGCPNDQPGIPLWRALGTQINKENPDEPLTYHFEDLYLIECSFCGDNC